MTKISEKVKKVSDEIASNKGDSLAQLQKEFVEQINSLRSDNKIVEQFKYFKPRERKVLVKVFKFRPSVEGIITTEIPLKIFDKASGKLMDRTRVENARIYPIVKVLAVGPDVPKDVIVGNLYTVCVDDIEGTQLNDEYLHLVNSFGREGSSGKIVNIPEGIPVRVPGIEKNWKRHKFQVPDKVGELTDDEKLIYLVPDLKLETTYECS